MEKKAFDRSKFKPAELSVVQQEEKRADNMGEFGGRRGFTQYVKLEDGINEMRVFPAMDGSSPYVPYCTCSLEVEVDKYENGKVVGKEIKDKKIFDAAVHSNVMGGKDPIELYIRYVEGLAEQYQDREEKKKFLAPLDWRTTPKGKVPGIKPIKSFVCYVCVKGETEIRRLQLRPQWFQEMNRISARETTDEVVTLDVFSDPDSGYPLIIEKSKDEKTGKDVYSILAKTPSRGQSWEQFFSINMIPDEQLEKLSKLEPLKDTYVNSYSERDWDFAMDGLKRFDQKHPEYNIFSNDQFLDELEALYKLVPASEKNEQEQENEPAKEEEKTSRPARTAPVAKPEPKEEPVSESKYPSIAKMKMFIRDYMEDKYPGVDLPRLSEKELQEWYDLAYDEKELPIEEPDAPTKEVEEPVEETVPEKEEKAVDKSATTEIPDDRMEQLRKIREMRGKRLGK